MVIRQGLYHGRNVHTTSIVSSKIHEVLRGGSVLTYNMISSTALPKVTFKRAPILSPSLLATLSVANPKSEARGMMATQLMANTTVGLMELSSPARSRIAPRAIPTGTKTNRTLIQLDRMMSFIDRQIRAVTGRQSGGGKP